MPMFAAVFVQIYAKILTLCILFLFAQCGQREGDPKNIEQRARCRWFERVHFLLILIPRTKHKI